MPSVQVFFSQNVFWDGNLLEVELQSAGQKIIEKRLLLGTGFFGTFN